MNDQTENLTSALDDALASGHDVNAAAEDLMTSVEASGDAEAIAAAETEIGLWLASRARQARPSVSLAVISETVRSLSSPEVAEAILARAADDSQSEQG
jgi:hypothetical protein